MQKLISCFGLECFWLRVVSCLLLLDLARPAQTAEVAVVKQGDDFLVTTPVYQARINGRTGLLDQMTVDGTVVIEKSSIDLGGLPFTKTTVTQESPTQILVYVSAEENKAVVDKALRIAYEVEATTLCMKVLATVGRICAGRGPRFELGKDVQMVRSLDFKEAIPMPALQGRTPWQRVKFYYANGSTLGLINEGAGNPINPNENGGVWNYQYARGGYVPNSEYVYKLIAERGTKKTLGAPAMQIVESSTPAVFYQGEPVQAALRIKKEHYQKLLGLEGLRIKYEVQNVYEQSVATGELALDLSTGADPVEVKVRLPVEKLGWYRAYFTVNDKSGSLLEGKERLIFSVLKHQANMGESFDNLLQTDYAIGLGFTRISINPVEVEQIVKTVDSLAEQAKGTDVVVSYQIGGSPVGNDPKKFGEVCFKLFERVKDKIPRVEIINEPNGTMQPREYIETFLRPAYENIKRASPNTRVIAPVLCGIGDDQVRYLDECYKLGLKELTDELSFHPYAGNFDDGWAVPSMEKILQVIARNGDQEKPIYFTEGGYGHGGWSDLRGMREIVKLVVEQYAWQNAVMGIDHRHNFYYFTDQMGYLDMWLRSNQLTPAAVALRTYTGFVKDLGRARKLDFGSLEVVRAFLYPGKERQVIVLWTSANWLPDPKADVTTEVTFTTSTKKLEWFDVFGNPLACKVRAKKLKLSVGSFPSYIVAPADARIVPVPEQWGTNLALASLGATAESSSEEGTSPAVSAIDGSTASWPMWRSLVPNELPQSLTVTLAGPAPVDRIGLWSYSARGYDIEAVGADGNWKRLVSRRDQPYQRFRLEKFKTIVTDQVRVTIVDSYGDRAEISELQIFSPAGGAGKGTELVNWALKANGATARASSEMVKEVTVAVQDWGAKTPRIQKVLLEGKAENAIDGKRLVGGWREFFPTTWVAAPGAPLPQWLEISFPEPRTISSVAVYTLAFANWSPATCGVRDWDVQVWDGQAWKTVDTVKGNAKVSKISRLRPPVRTTRIRVVVNATNDPEGTVGLMEVQAFGPK